MLGRNPLDRLDWEQRFMKAWADLCKMEARAEHAEAQALRLKDRLSSLDRKMRAKVVMERKKK